MELTDEELINLAKEQNIKIMAITDHDTLEGLKNIPKENKKQLVLTTCSPTKDQYQLIINSIQI